MNTNQGAAALTLLLLSTAAVATNGYFAHGYSASQRAMGGAGTAMTEDALVAPCDCRGDTRYLHVQCLQKWYQASITGMV